MDKRNQVKRRNFKSTEPERGFNNRPTSILKHFGKRGKNEISSSKSGDPGKEHALPNRSPHVKVSEERIFPGRSILVVHIVTLIVRVWIASDRRNWWLLHPDEVFQSVEVAHSERYGYGFRPYEYLPPPTRNSTSTVERQEAALGMYSLRSFIYPEIYAIVFTVVDSMGIKMSPFQVSRIFHAAIAAHLPLSVYIFVKVTFLCGDIATMAAALTSLSVHLTVFGTHTLINSFLSPFLIILCAQMITYLRTWSQQQEVVLLHGDHIQIVNGSDETENNNMSLYKPPKETPLQNFSCFSNLLSPRKSSLRVAESRALLMLKLVGVGFGIGIICYTRIDTVVFLTLVILPVTGAKLLAYFRLITPALLFVAVGGSLSVLLGGYVDKLCYDSWFISPIQWFRFNVLSDFSTSLFGWSGNMEYVQKILIRDWYMVLFCVSPQVVTILLMVFSRTKNHLTEFRKLFLILLLSTCGVLVVYSTKGHKEIRFVHNAIAMIHVCSAAAIVFISESLISKYLLVKRCFCFAFIVAAALNLFTGLPRSSEKSNAEWSFQGMWDSNYVNECLRYIGLQSDSSGVFLARSVHMTGGYSVLHKDIPLLTLVHYEFQEFDEHARRQLRSNSAFALNDLVKVSVINRVSNYITIDNPQYLVKYLISKPLYNYIVIHKNTKFIRIGYTKVFEAGTMQVLKRNNWKKSDQELYKYGRSIESVANGTVLEYEGSWLVTLGLRNLAKERLHDAIKADPTRVRAYQLLAIMFQEEGDRHALNAVLARCYSQNSRETCNAPQPKVVLYQDYKLNLSL